MFLGSFWAVLGLSLAILGLLSKSWPCLEASRACLGEVFGLVLAVLVLSWARFGLSEGILGGLGSQNAILEGSFMFSACFRSRLGTKDVGPQKNMFLCPFGRLRGGVPKGYRKNFTSLDAPHGRGR